MQLFRRIAKGKIQNIAVFRGRRLVRRCFLKTHQGGEVDNLLVLRGGRGLCFVAAIAGEGFVFVNPEKVFGLKAGKIHPHEGILCLLGQARLRVLVSQGEHQLFFLFPGRHKV